MNDIKRNPDSLIAKYLNIVEPHTDAPRVFLEAGAYSIISSLLGRFFTLKDWKANKLNTMIILSSIPCRMRRSSALNYVNNVIYNASIGYYWLHDGNDKTEAQRRFLLSSIEEGSPEGLCDKIIGGINNDVHNFYINSLDEKIRVF